MTKGKSEKEISSVWWLRNQQGYIFTGHIWVRFTSYLWKMLLNFTVVQSDPRSPLSSWFYIKSRRSVLTRRGSYWCVASSGRSGCTSAHRRGSCRCWGCTPSPPGWVCSSAPVRRASHRRKVCLETSPHPRCRSQTRRVKSGRTAAHVCQEQAGWRRLGLQLVDEDVRDPNVGGGYRHLLDFVEVFWVPHQELICPRLEHSDLIIHNLPITFWAMTKCWSHLPVPHVCGQNLIFFIL